MRAKRCRCSVRRSTPWPKPLPNGGKDVIPANEADDLYVTVGVFIHWEAKDDKKIEDFNYRATKEALARAVKGEPKASEVTAKKELGTPSVCRQLKRRDRQTTGPGSAVAAKAGFLT